MSTNEDQATIVECATCGTPGIAKFNENGLTELLIVCKCPRPSVEEANAMARKKVSDKQEG